MFFCLCTELLLPPWRSTPVPQLTLHRGVHLPGFLQVHGGVITCGFILPAVQHKETSLAVVALQPPPQSRREIGSFLWVVRVPEWFG